MTAAEAGKRKVAFPRPRARPNSRPHRVEERPGCTITPVYRNSDHPNLCKIDAHTLRKDYLICSSNVVYVTFLGKIGGITRNKGNSYFIEDQSLMRKFNSLLFFCMGHRYRIKQKCPKNVPERGKGLWAEAHNPLFLMVRQEGIEPPTR